MKYSSYIFVLLLSVLGISCERTIDFVETSESVDHSLTINAIAIEGSPLSVYLNRTYSIKDTPVLPGTYGYEQIFNYTTDWDYFKKNEFYKYTAVLDANVEAIVNGTDRYQLTLDSDALAYKTDYKPQVGDRIKITASVGGEEAYAETIVPAKPKIEVIEKEIIKDTIVRIDNTLNIRTYMRINCRLYDSGGEQYYRLRVRNEREGYGVVEDSEDGHVIGTVVDYNFRYDFSSEDPLFGNPDVINHYVTAYSDMESYYYQTRHHTDTFSNSTFDGQDYTFSIIVNQIGILWSHMEHNGTMETYVDYYGRDRIEDAFRLPPRVMIELQAITPDYYKYLKSVELYNDSESEKESAVGIYHNVQNGWGIFGAMSYDRHFVEYGE